MYANIVDSYHVEVTGCSITQLILLSFIFNKHFSAAGSSSYLVLSALSDAETQQWDKISTEMLLIEAFRRLN